MKCPKCLNEMQKITYEDIEVDRCTNCKGLWFDILEKDDLLKVKGSEVIDTGDADAGKEYNRIDHYDCPNCNVEMIRMVDNKQPHIWFESCPQCYGMFLDAGEFRDLKEHTIVDWFRDLFTKERD